MLDFITVALKNMLNRPATRNYPKVVRKPYENQKGHVTIDLPSCVYCGMCSRKCPASAIKVTRQEKEWSIDRFKCIVCGECVRSCPKKCLGMSGQYTPPAAKKSVDVFRLPEEPVKEEKTAQDGAGKTDA